MGTTTATAIFPPCDIPPEVVFADLVDKGTAPVEDDDRPAAEDRVNEDVGCASGAAVEVITTTEGLPVPPADAGLCVMTEVMRTTTLDGGGAAADGTRANELGGAREEGTGTAEGEGSGVRMELVRIWEGTVPEEIAVSNRLISTMNRQRHDFTYQLNWTSSQI